MRKKHEIWALEDECKHYRDRARQAEDKLHEMSMRLQSAEARAVGERFFKQWSFRLPSRDLRLSLVGRGRWEVQETDEQGRYVWTSDRPYLAKRDAIRLAKWRTVGERNTVRVRHVGTGVVAYERTA